jgi:GNAT superfamily N-acetyltransferase
MNKNSKKFITLYKQLGFKKAFAKMLHFMISKIYAKKDDLLLVKNLDEKIKFSKDNYFQIQPITPHHSSIIRQFNERYRATSNVTASIYYLKNNYKGFMASLNDEMTGYWWWVDNKVDPAITHPCIFRFGLNLKKDEVYGFDYFIAPQYRGHGNAVKFLSMVYDELKKMGYNRICGYVAANNTPARWLYDINGYKVIKRIISYEVFSLFLFQDKCVFVKNTRWNSRYSFDHRLLFSFKSS